jgi:hypothetical protein
MDNHLTTSASQETEEIDQTSTVSIPSASDSVPSQSNEEVPPETRIIPDAVMQAFMESITLFLKPLRTIEELLPAFMDNFIQVRSYLQK